MATNYTANYGLCQWEPEDNFLREEFNQDNAKIDAALKGVADTAEEQVAAVSHDVYNLILQSHYDGKTTSWKKALVFDGFQDQSMIASLSPSLLRLDRVVGLCRKSQEDVNMGYNEEATFTSTGKKTKQFTSQGYGTMDSITFRTGNANNQDITGNCTITVYLNNKQVYSAQVKVNFYAAGLEQTLTFPAVNLSPNDQFSILLRPGSSVYLLYGPESEESGELGGVIHINPAAGESGTITTPSLTLPDRTGLRAWVRFKGGTVSLAAARTGGDALPFATLGDRSTVNVDGEACTEREFALENPPETGRLTFTLGLSLENSQQMEVFDYGILLL